MPVTGPIPLPQSGMDVVAGGMNNIMQNILARKQMAQADMQQRRAIEQQQRALAQADMHFRQQQALREAQEKRMAGMSDLQKQLYQAQVQKAQQDAAWTRMLMGGGQNAPAPGMQGQQPSQPQQGTEGTSGAGGFDALQKAFTGGGMFRPPEQQMMQQQGNPEAEAPHPGGMPMHEGEEIVSPGDPSKAFMNRAAGFKGIPKIGIQKDENGHILKIYPSGMITRIKTGPDASQMAQSKAMGKYQGESYGKAVDTSMALQEQKSNLDRIVESIESHPNPDEVIGPVNKYFAQWFASPEDKAFLGDIMSTTGNVVLAAAKNIKGAFTGRDQSLINSMKPNASDPYYVFLGKLKAMGELTDMAQKRADMYADLLHSGVSPHRALQQAQKMTDISGITDKYQKAIDLAHKRDALKSGKIPEFRTKEESTEFLNSLSPDERMRLLARMGG